ncbi:MAG: FG-GAP repeat protein [Phycisphaerae bacterium]|nr:FG-GAP repeat protein [Phycisphaerae bacterium]
MNKLARIFGLKLCVVAGVALLATTIGGCPTTTGGTLTVTVTATPAATVDKTVELTATVTGGTTPYTYAWTQVSGPAATIADATANPATFVPQAAGTYTFSVTVTDAATTAGTGAALVEVIVGDIQFNLPVSAGSTAGTVRVSGNPALVTLTNRANLLDFLPRVTVFDPQYTDDQNTQMTVTYDVVSVPTGAREQDVSLDRDFDTLTNQGTGDMDTQAGSIPTLDGVVTVTVRPNPDATFTTLTNLASTFTSNGWFVPGDYVFRATVTNPAGLQRSRDLTISLEVEGIAGWLGATSLLGNSAGPATYAVKTLPAGSPGYVTNKVMTPMQTSTLTVTVFPSTTTSYRFYLLDNNNVAHPEYITQSAETLVATDAAQDITVTIGATAGLPTATYRLAFESFDGLGQLNGRWVEVNRPAAVVTTPPIAPTGTPVSFHVTNDYLAQGQLNAALVGMASNNPATPTSYQGWMGPDGGVFGARSVLADTNLDGAMDVITFTGAALAINTTGFVDGSTAAYLHPDNSGNFAAALPMTPDFALAAGLGTAQFDVAAGDLNGDGLADLAVSGQAAIGGPGTVIIFFHTGDPAQPYSSHADQTLVITAPRYDRATYNTNTDVFTQAAEPTRTLFGRQLAIAEMTGDAYADLIITDPGFSTYQVINAVVPTTGIYPPAANAFYEGQQGRVYVFAGGNAGELLPGRPDLYTSLLVDRAVTDGSIAAFPTNPVLTTDLSESQVKYTYAYEGNLFDQIGYALDAVDGQAVVASAVAPGTGTLAGYVDILEPVNDGETITVSITQPGGAPVARVYEFDDNAAITLGNAAVGMGGANLAADARAALIDRINNLDPAEFQILTAMQDPARDERVLLYYAGGTVDGATRAMTIATTMTGTNNFIGARAFTQDADGVVYRLAAATASGTLANPIVGTPDSDMGLGTAVAIGNLDDTTTFDDLAIAASDAGDAWGVNGDGAVFLLLNGSNDFAANAVRAQVGVSSLYTGGFGLGTADHAATGVGSALAMGDVNDDGYCDVLYTEPGFDRIYLHLGATTVSDTPDVTFIGVTFAATGGGSLGAAGSFLFGDITGDTENDWIYLDGTDNFGFAGFER